MSILPACLGLASLLTELSLVWRRRAGKVPGASEQDRGSLRLLWRVTGGAMAAGALLAGFGIGLRLPQPFPWGWSGLGLFVAGTIIRWWAIWHLGRFFTVDVAIADDHRLVDTGPYRWVRHPSYTGLLLQFIGLALSFGNVLTVFVITFPVCLALARRMQVEEATLLSKLGESYLTYRQGTKRLIPMLY